MNEKIKRYGHKYLSKNKQQSVLSWKPKKELFQRKQSRVSNVAEHSYSLDLKIRNLLETMMRVASVEW